MTSPLDVPCPARALLPAFGHCGAQPGQPCNDRLDGKRFPNGAYHPEREAAARELAARQDSLTNQPEASISHYTPIDPSFDAWAVPCPAPYRSKGPGRSANGNGYCNAPIGQPCVDRFNGKQIHDKVHNERFAAALRHQSHQSKEDNIMNSNTRAAALDQIVLEDATERLRPIHAKVMRVVDATKVNQAILVTWTDDRDAKNAQFYFRRFDNEWEYGNGSEILLTDRVVRFCVAKIDEFGAKVRRMKVVK